MSVFVDIVRYDENGPEEGNVVAITAADLEEAVKELPGFEFTLDEDDPEEFAVKLPGTGLFVESDGDTLTCQLAHNTDIDELLEELRELTAQIPGAVIEDEEGDSY